MSFDPYGDFIRAKKAAESYLYDDKPISSFPTDGPSRGVPSIPSAILGSILTADRLKKISDQLIAGTATASDYFDFPVFKNAPPPQILGGDNEGVPAVIQPPIRVAPPVSVRPTEPPQRPPVVVRPPVSSWPPPYC